MSAAEPQADVSMSNGSDLKRKLEADEAPADAKKPKVDDVEASKVAAIPESFERPPLPTVEGKSEDEVKDLIARAAKQGT